MKFIIPLLLFVPSLVYFIGLFFECKWTRRAPVLLLFCFPSIAFAQIDLPQGCKSTFDSVYITERPNPSKQQFGPAAKIYYLTRDYICEDFRTGPQSVPIGDSSAVVNNLKRNAIDLSRQWAASVIVSAEKNAAVINPVQTINKTTEALFNLSIYAPIAAEFPDSLFLGDYRFTNEAGTAVDATLTKNAQQYRFRWASNNKEVRVMSDNHIRIIRYTANKDLDFVRRDANSPKWVNQEGAGLINKTVKAKQSRQ